MTAVACWLRWPTVHRALPWVHAFDDQRFQGSCGHAAALSGCKDAEKIAISHLVDGMPQRMIPNEYLAMLEKASPMKRLRIALGLALQWKAETGMTTGQALSIFMKAMREDSSSVAQTVMAANAPMLLQRSMVDGNPAEGVMSAGQVAALIGKLDSCEEVIGGIVRQAMDRRNALNALTPA
jgi:nitronate monooxygenase